jgi:EAL and modified HD-GYP domain-containing signal transduction protein
VEGLERLHGLGYRIALDDFDPDGPTAPLLEFASIVKYDLSQIGLAALRERISVDHDAGRTVVVERVETVAEYNDVSDAGADWFQGYFFARPATLTSTAIEPNTLTLVQLLAHINRPEATMNDIVEAVSHDVAMSVKVLRYVNSAAHFRHGSIDSIQTAAVLVGQDHLRSWTALALLSSIDDKPTELVNLALTRAKFCELVALARRLPDPDAFYTLGMLSLLDAMTDTSMPTITSKIAIGDDIRSALLGDDSELCAVLDAARRIERAMADRTLDAVDGDSLRAYRMAMIWATDIVTTTPR